MVGTSGRSGGKNRKPSPNSVGDGPPVSPRVLSPRAQTLFSWLVDKLKADDPTTGWARIDGVTLATLSEVLETQEKIASLIADDPADLALLRLRNQFAAQVVRLSALIGMTPIDRCRQPAVDVEPMQDDPILASIFKRMKNG